ARCRIRRTEMHDHLESGHTKCNTEGNGKKYFRQKCQVKRCNATQGLAAIIHSTPLVQQMRPQPAARCTGHGGHVQNDDIHHIAPTAAKKFILIMAKFSASVSVSDDPQCAIQASRAVAVLPAASKHKGRAGTAELVEDAAPKETPSW